MCFIKLAIIFYFCTPQVYYSIGSSNSRRRRRRDNHEESIEVTGEAAVLSADDLKAQTPYSYEVSAANNFMEGPRSSPQDFQTRASGMLWLLTKNIFHGFISDRVPFSFIIAMKHELRLTLWLDCVKEILINDTQSNAQSTFIQQPYTVYTTPFNLYTTPLQRLSNALALFI